jgi:hypothetical protein
VQFERFLHEKDVEEKKNQNGVFCPDLSYGPLLLSVYRR